MDRFLIFLVRVIPGKSQWARLLKITKLFMPHHTKHGKSSFAPQKHITKLTCNTYIIHLVINY